MVVRTEPHEPRLIGRGVGYWRVGHGRNVTYQTAHVRHVAQRAERRWWKRHIRDDGWSVRYRRTLDEARRLRRGQYFCIAIVSIGPAGCFSFAGYALYLYTTGTRHSDFDNPAASCVAFSIVGIVFIALMVGVWIAERHSRRPGAWCVTATGISGTNPEGPDRFIRWDQASSIGRPTSPAIRVVGARNQILVPRVPSLIPVIHAIRQQYVPDRVEREMRQGRWAVRRMLMYVLTAGVIGSIGLYVLLGSARYVVGWGLYVGMATIWIASTIWFSKRFEKYRIDVMRRRRHAANRQISTTPLPSPTTPEDSQT
ncbi:MAG: hypothetical protein KIT54_05230 [Phycisphaeraceae bacterium]|nr:hypothetical protein [Phycisphaeraceae bacterium]